jgi:uncharacterized protein YndB with AHSA1/START domain
VLHKEAEVDCGVEKLWWAWTTTEGVGAWFSEANWVDLRPDGPYEIYFDSKVPGERGSEGSRILCYVLREMLAFTWNFPPSLAEIRWEHTFVVVRFLRLDGERTRVTLDQLGWRTGPLWEAGYAYFDAAWGSVLDEMRRVVPGLRLPLGR